MNNLIKKVVFLMALGCVEQTSCDWLSTWNAFKDDAGSKWHEFKGKVEDKWHNLKNDHENYKGTDYKAIDYGYAREGKEYIGGGEYYEDYGIGEKYWKNDFKKFLDDPEQQTLTFKSYTEKDINFQKTSINKGISIYYDDVLVTNFSLYDIQHEAAEVQDLLSKAMCEYVAITRNELLDFIKILGVNATNDFDTFLTLVDNIKSGKKRGLCVFKNNNDEFIIFKQYNDKSITPPMLFVAGNDRSDIITTDDPSYKRFIKPYFTEEQLEKIYNKTVQKK